MKTILLIGKNGQLGWELQSALVPLGNVIALDRSQMDLTSPDAIRREIRRAAPTIIVNAAGYTAVDKAESEPEVAMRVNAIASGVLAEEAKRANALLLHFSTDYVYDGMKGTAYLEDDPPNPVNLYGRSKLEGESAIIATGCTYLILRTSWIYSARGANFVLAMLRLAREKTELAVVDDQIGSPTWARALARSTTELLARLEQPYKVNGVYHLSSQGYTSRFNFAQQIINAASKISNKPSGWASFRSIATTQFPLPAARPLNAATSKNKIKQDFGIQMPNWEIQLSAFLDELFGSAPSNDSTGYGVEPDAGAPASTRAQRSRTATTSTPSSRLRKS